ncbi:hypothetical protein PAXINDRAFT_29211, partial [Paxillus involutus ATCC 200175]
LEGHTRGVLGLAFFPDDRRLISGSLDKSLIIWDGTAGEVEKRLTGHTGPVRSVAIAPNGRVFASGSEDGTVRMWKGTTGKQNGEPIAMGPMGGGVWALSFSPSGQRVAATGNGQVQICDVPTQGLVGDPLPIPGGGKYSVALSPDGSRIAADGAKGSIRIWDFGSMASGREGENDSDSDTVWSPQAKVIFDSLKGHSDYVRWATFAPDGRQLVTASRDAMICQWDMRSGAQMGKPLRGHSGPINDGVLSHDGDTLATASRDRTVRFWDLKTGNQKSRFLQHESDVRRVALSRDGSLLASGCYDGKVYLWDMKA